MTIILKSNSKFTGKSLGDIHGVLGSPSWLAMANFAAGTYYNKSNKVGFSDVLSFSNVQKSWLWKDGIDGGEIIPFAVNEPKIDSRGITLNSPVNNILLNSSSPASQNVPIQQSMTYFYRVIGDGTINVTHPDASLSSGIVSAGGIGYIRFPFNANIATKAVVTITGSNTYGHVGRIYNTKGYYTNNLQPVPTTTTAIGLGNDVLTLASPVINKLNSNFTLLMHVDFNQVDAVTSVQTIAELRFAGSSTVSMTRTSVSSGTGKTTSIRARSFYDAAEKSIIATNTNSTSVTVALAVGGGSLSLAVNGLLIDTKAFPAIAVLSELQVGNAKDWIDLNVGLDGVVSQLAVYDEKITGDRLADLSKSWV